MKSNEKHIGGYYARLNRVGIRVLCVKRGEGE